MTKTRLVLAQGQGNLNVVQDFPKSVSTNLNCFLQFTSTQLFYKYILLHYNSTTWEEEGFL